MMGCAMMFLSGAPQTDRIDDDCCKPRMVRRRATMRIAIRNSHPIG